jgi:hypothetical protein
MNLAKAFAVGSLLLLSTITHASDSRKALANDYANSINAVFGYILTLQGDINSGKLAADAISNERLTSELYKRFETAAGYSYSAISSTFAGHRQTFIDNYLKVINDYRSAILKGGQDAFVPAFFRSELLREMNDTLAPRGIFAVATMRDSELINADRSIELLMRDMPTQAQARNYLNKGEMKVVSDEIQGHYLHYRPMTLADGCVSCHARNGLVQKVGEYGGALIINIASGVK